MWVFGIFLISLLSASCLICWFVIYFLKREGGGGGKLGDNQKLKSSRF
jgi:hypothetical protein